MNFLKNLSSIPKNFKQILFSRIIKDECNLIKKENQNCGCRIIGKENIDNDPTIGTQFTTLSIRLKKKVKYQNIKPEINIFLVMMNKFYSRFIMIPRSKLDSGDIFHSNKIERRYINGYSPSNKAGLIKVSDNDITDIYCSHGNIYLTKQQINDIIFMIENVNNPSLVLNYLLDIGFIKDFTEDDLLEGLTKL